MIGKIIGAIAGKKASEHLSGVGGTGGAVLGVAAASLARRLGPLGLIAAAAGGYAIKHVLDKQKANAAPGQPARSV